MAYGFDDNKEKVDVATQEDFEQVSQNVTSLLSKEWKSGGNVSSGNPVFLSFSDYSYSTMLILTVNATNANLNNLYVIRKSAITESTPNPDAFRLGGGASTASEYLSVGGQYGDPPFVSISLSQNQAAVFYQILV